MSKVIVNTKFVIVKESDTGTHLRVFIALSKGGWIEHNEFDNNLQGLVAALDLATQCCAGKFYPKCLVSEESKAIGLRRLELKQDT